MQRKSVGVRAIQERLRRTMPVIVIAAVFLAVCLTLLLVMGGSFSGPSVYNSYTLQALAWREGRASLGVDHPHLELAVYEGDWYVSFPPVPTVPMYLLTFLFGENTPDALMVKIYALISLCAIYLTLEKQWNRWHAACAACLLALGSSMLPLFMEGAVWYQAQLMAFCLTACSVALMVRGRMTPALFLYALAVGCRPFNVCYGPLLILLWYLRRKNRSVRLAARRLWPGIVLGLMVAASYAAYNYARFGNVFEFGHNYLPEFTRSEHGQFSLNYLTGNTRQFLLGLPVAWTEGGWSYSMFGSSVFLANPALLLMVVWYLWDVIRRRAGLKHHLTIAFLAVHLFLLLLHRTGGGFQLGARYAVDLIPYSLIYLTIQKERSGLRWWETAILYTGFIVMFIGCSQIHI